MTARDFYLGFGRCRKCTYVFGFNDEGMMTKKFRDHFSKHLVNGSKPTSEEMTASLVILPPSQLFPAPNSERALAQENGSTMEDAEDTASNRNPLALGSESEGTDIIIVGTTDEEAEDEVKPSKKIQSNKALKRVTKSLKLEKYNELFDSEKIDLKSLSYMDHEELRSIGVKSYGDRHRLLWKARGEMMSRYQGSNDSQDPSREPASVFPPPRFHGHPGSGPALLALDYA